MEISELMGYGKQKKEKSGKREASRTNGGNASLSYNIGVVAA